MTRIGSFALPASRDIAETSDPGCVVSQLRTRSRVERPRVELRLARLGGGPREGQRMGRRLVARVFGRGPQEALPREHTKLRRPHRADHRGLETQLARPFGIELTERRYPFEKLSQPLERYQELGGELPALVSPLRGARRPTPEIPQERREFGSPVGRRRRADQLDLLARQGERPIRGAHPGVCVHSRLAATSASSLRSPLESMMCPASFSRLKRSATIVRPLDALST